MSWVNRYVGIPFRDRGRDKLGADCWGLVRLVLSEQFDIDVPDFSELYETTSDRERLAAIYNSNDELANWRRVDVKRARTGDVIVSRIIGRPVHFAIVVSPGWMLHTQTGLNSHLSEYRSSLWSARIVDVLRHKSRTNVESGKHK